VGRAVGRAAHRRLAREGIIASSLHPCEPQARGGTRLPGCVKTYLPAERAAAARGGAQHLPGAAGRRSGAPYATLT